MQFEEFESTVKTILTNLYDFAALENIPSLPSCFPIPETVKGTRGDYIRNLFIEYITKLKPDKTTVDHTSPDWRSFTILHSRYIEGKSSQEVANQLSISERQLRRYTRKAINGLALLFWENNPLQQSSDTEEEVQQAFTINREETDLREILLGVIALLSNRITEEKIDITIQQTESKISVKSDRIILRQILIGLVNELLQAHVKDIAFSCTCEQDQPTIKISSCSYELQKAVLHEQDTTQEKSLHFWANQLFISIREDFQPVSQKTTITLTFPTSQQKTILVVDDQEPTLRMFTRYLSKTNFKIFGLRKPNKVLEKAIELQPALILLDIMMPKVDGWEIFQSLKVNEKTKNIPVIICSAWGEPELAKSLGATAFLRKPVTQRDLLSTIKSIGIMD